MVAETSEASKNQQSKSATRENNRFANLSERRGLGTEKILEDNWCFSTLKGEFQTSIVIILILHD